MISLVPLQFLWWFYVIRVTGLRTRSIFIRVQVRVCSPYTCAVFLGRHDISKTVKDMHLCCCYEKRNFNLRGLINNKYFFDKFLVLKFPFSKLELEQFYSSSEKLFFRVWQNNRVFSNSSSSSQPCYKLWIGKMLIPKNKKPKKYVCSQW